VFNNINHFVARKLYLNVAKDKWYPAYEGYMNGLKLLLCKGAYNPNYIPGNLPLVSYFLLP